MDLFNWSVHVSDDDCNVVVVVNFRRFTEESKLSTHLFAVGVDLDTRQASVGPRMIVLRLTC